MVSRQADPSPWMETSRSLLNYVGPTLPGRMLRGPLDVGNGLDFRAIVVCLKRRT